MRKENLLEYCLKLYGSTFGPLVHKAMIDISERDFCVATGLKLPEVSIAISCSRAGRMFSLSGIDYDHLVMPDGGIRPISRLSYMDLKQYLPRKQNRSGRAHCFFEPPDESEDVNRFSEL